MTRGPLLRPEPAGAEFVTLLTPPDWSAVFGGPGPLEMEIGSGAGAFALGYAARHPAVRYVAIEWRKKYARELEHRARARGLSNLRVVEADARAVIPRLFAPGSLAGIHLQFPDPWWKRAHRKRAILTPGFATLEAAGWHNPLGPGSFHLADPDDVPSSRERRYLESGEPVYRARLTRR